MGGGGGGGDSKRFGSHECINGRNLLYVLGLGDGAGGGEGGGRGGGGY